MDVGLLALGFVLGALFGWRWLGRGEPPAAAATREAILLRRLEEVEEALGDAGIDEEAWRSRVSRLERQNRQLEQRLTRATAEPPRAQGAPQKS